jgi:predicted secreted protein
MRFLVLFAISLLAQFATALTAHAGDVASLILGFSRMAIFAFEGAASRTDQTSYANRYYIDTTSDGFLKGTPIKVSLTTRLPLDAARLAARQRRGDHQPGSGRAPQHDRLDR